jgi:mycothiol synthase
MGWIASLSVRKPWRKRGLGLALLHHAFGEFWRLGERTIGLGVDAENPTGATRLYERAGMHVVSDYAVYEKRLPV